VELNGLTCVRLNQVAVSDRDGWERLLLPCDPRAQSNASLVKGFMGMPQKEGAPVRLVSLDSYCRERDISSADLLKIDVEGTELQVLRGAKGMVDGARPDIILEVLDPYDKKLDEFFSTRPYRKFLITDEGLREVGEIKAHPSYRDYYLSCAPTSL
jgi:FkbM family methyltransferase